MHLFPLRFLRLNRQPSFFPELSFNLPITHLFPLIAFFSLPSIASAADNSGTQPFVFTSHFDQGLTPFQIHHSGKWEIKTDSSGNAFASLTEEGEFEEPPRRPTAFLLVPNLIWSDLTLDIRGRSTANMKLHGRDLVLIFAYVDYHHFYYAHLSNSNNGKTHNVIMKVDGDHRTLIQQPTFPEPRLSGQWQHFRLVRLSSGKIEVYLDKMDAPLMTANDTSFPAGLVGFGSFDETGDFDDLHLEGTLLHSYK